MSTAPLLFLDANVLFWAALGGPAFDLLLELAGRGRIRAVTSTACELEAAVNLSRKHPDRLESLDEVLHTVRVEDVDPETHAPWASALVHGGDVHVLAAARALGADVLVTGDVTHFGGLMERADLPLKVRTPRAFLLEGPS